MNKIKQLLKKQGFTLVELIIVIAIIAVLAVAAFMMLTKWLGKSRDSRRLGDIWTIQKWLEVWYADVDMWNGLYPDISTQDNRVALMSWDDIIWYQGIVDIEVAKLANLQKTPLDPSDANKYTYTVTANRKKFQVLAMLEDGEESSVGLIDSVSALDYNNRYPVVKWFEIWVFLGENNLPLQYIGAYQDTGVNLMDEAVTTDFRVIVSDKEEYTGTGVVLSPIVDEEAWVVVVDTVVAVDGVCGSDDGWDFEIEPTNLCIAGTASNVLDEWVGAQYTWSCVEIDGWTTANCSANHIYPPLDCEGTSSTCTSTIQTSCKSIYNGWFGTTDGVYWIDSDGAGSVSPYKVYCDMTTDGWGWTMIWKQTNFETGNINHNDTLRWNSLILTSTYDGTTQWSIVGDFTYTEILFKSSSSLWFSIPNTLSNFYNGTTYFCRDLSLISNKTSNGIDLSTYKHLVLRQDIASAVSVFMVGKYSSNYPAGSQCWEVRCSASKNWRYDGTCQTGGAWEWDWMFYVR